jgi:tetratricopeptide (TPR) repeat protein
MYNESEASRIELLSEDFEDLARDPETKNPVATTWAISFDQITEPDILATDLLSFMACLDRQGIPKAFLLQPESSVKLSNALGLLKAYSLITASQNDKVFDMHRLVNLATCNWLRLNDRFEYWAERCLKLVSEEFPSGEHGTLNMCDSYLPHALVVLGYGQLLAANVISRAFLAYKVSRYLQNRGIYNSAKTLAEKAVQLGRKVLGPEHPDTLSSMNYLGSVLDNQGKYDEAERMHRLVLDIRQKVLGPEHPYTLTSMTKLALVPSGQGKYDEAKGIRIQALDISKKVLGPEHPDTLTSISNLALVLDSQGKYEEAEVMHRRALNIRREVLDAEHPDTLMSMNNLASVLGSQGKYDEAEGMHRRAIDIREKVLGPKHPDTLTSMDNLALTLDSQGKHDGAEV